MRKLLLFGALLLAGCPVKLVDPCADVTGTCLAIQVHPSASVTEVSELLVQVTGPNVNISNQIINGNPTKLPVAVAVKFGNDAFNGVSQSLALEVSVIGSYAGQHSSGGLPVALSRGQHLAVDITLEPTMNVDAGADLTTDLSAPDLSPLAPDLLALDLAPDCSILYVSPAGDNGNNGCAPSTPKQTIGAAVAAFSSYTKEIHVCAGSYDEVAIASDAKILGGFSCSTWQRTPSYGYPTFDSVNETIIQNAQDVSALVVQGGTVVIDGITLKQHPIAAPTKSAAVTLKGGNIDMSNSNVHGAPSNGADHQTVGVLVSAGAKVDLHHCAIDGGGGLATGLSAGSHGVLLDETSTADVHVHDNDINGGSGRASWVGSIGVVALNRAGTTTTIENNKITAGSGQSTGTWSANTVALHVAGTVDILHNQIDAGSIQGSTNGTVAVYKDYNGGLMNLRGNRIYGGKFVSSASISTTTYGVLILDGPAEITNNMIDGGDGAANAVGIYGQSGNGQVIRENTIVAGTASGSTYALYQDNKGNSWEIENNILAGYGGDSTALYSANCPSQGGIASFLNNLTFGAKVLAYGTTPGGTCTPSAIFATDDLAQSEITSKCSAGTMGGCGLIMGAKASGNVNIQTSCTGDSGCIVFSGCGSAGGCAAALFDAWDVASAGYSTLFGAGWKLKAGDPCAVTRSSLDLTGQVSVDLYGNARTPPPSMGAHQFNDPMQCK